MTSYTAALKQWVIDTYQTKMGADDNYVTDAEKAALHSHANKTALDQVSGINTGDQDLSGYALAADLDAEVTALAEDPTSDLGASLSSTYGRKDVPPVAPSLSPITERMEPLRLAMIQEPGAVYATYSRVGEVPTLDKSTDGGTSWTTLSTMPATPKLIAKLASGTLLAIEETSYTTPGGSNPRVWRSTDDGGTWAEVFPGLTFPPLGASGLCEGTDGSVLIAEYGNVSPHQYRIMRSTDDGVTWGAVFTSDGTEPAGDPGHIHSVTYDPIAGAHVAFCDRPIVDGVSGPRIYTSDDNGATWSLVGESTSVDHPCFVAPMYFADYIAWGSDNQINGRISRILRADFYAGQFGRSETVAYLSQKAMYFTFPLRPDVWAVSMAGEHIASGSQTGGPGSTMNEVWLVSGNGAVVSGGVESYYSSADPGDVSGVRSSFPHYKFDRTDHEGFCWVNTPVARPRPYAALPVTQGWEPPNKRVDHVAAPVLPPRVPLYLKRSNAAGDAVRFIECIPDLYVEVANNTAATRARLRFLDDGCLQFLWGTTAIAQVNASGFEVKPVLTTTGVNIEAVDGSPEGVITAPPGSVRVNFRGGAGTTLYVKESGFGNTGWVAK